MFIRHVYLNDEVWTRNTSLESSTLALINPQLFVITCFTVLWQVCTVLTALMLLKRSSRTGLVY